MKEKVIDGHKYYFNDKNQKLLSFSSASKPFNNKYLFVNKNILDNSSEFGKDLMIMLEAVFCGKEIAGNSVELNQALKTLLTKLERENKKVLYIEKHINNDIWHGYLDMECEDCFIELKTRSNFHLDFATIIQCEIYQRICKKKYEVWYYNKKTNEVRTLTPKPDDILKANAVINAWELVNSLLNNN